ncbi:MAG: DUF6702 family protein [Planctomycetaceae bacterium]|jgi:hypothetical protein
MKTHLTVLLLTALGGATAAAHSAHTQMTEVEWNSVSGCFEVAMKLDAAALEDSVSMQTGKRFRLESSKHVDNVLAELMPGRFRIDAGNESQPGTVRWAGHELQLHTVWLYFEYVPACVRPTESTETDTSIRSTQVIDVRKITVQNRWLMDVRQDAVHFIQFRHGQAVRQGHCSSVESCTDFAERERESATWGTPQR